MKKKYHPRNFYSLLWILLFNFFALSNQAQTVHISPTGAGGFELGATLLDNGWNESAPTANPLRNRWVSDTGATPGFSGARCAYICNNTNTSPAVHSYGANIARVTHLYRDITIASGEQLIELSFSYISNGDSNLDRMRIWLAPTSYTPIGNTEINAAAGRIQIGNNDYSGQNTWSHGNIITIPTSYSGTSFRLVFEWRNDNTIANNPPIALDNISLTSVSNGMPSYCNTGGTDSTRYINNFFTSGSITNISNATGFAAGGYGNYTSQAIVASAGTSVNFDASFTGGTFGFNIWVDWNKNGVFDNAEKMYNSGAYVNPASGTFTIPAAASSGNYQMRIRAHWLDTDPPPCGSNGYGEIEDYTVTVQTLPCAGAPSSLTASSITTSAAVINYSAGTPAPASGYIYYYSTSPTPPNFASTGDGTSTTTSFPLTALTSGTQYYVWIRSNCGGSNGMGAWNGPLSFTTLLSNDNCSSAITAPVNTGLTCTNTISGTTVGATQSMVGCVGNADDDVWYKFVATSTSHTITVSTGTIRDIVFQVLSNCSASNSLACIDNTVGTSAETTTINSLTVGSTYYIRIYSYSNGSNQGTFTLCITTPVICTPGTGMGTSNACVITAAGGLGLSGAPAPNVTCTSGVECVTLEANYLALGQTTNYTVSTIPYAPPYQFSCLANTVDATIDDVWSPIVNLPFNFCFYGTTYSSVVISSNGVISFDTVTNSPGDYSTWSFSENLPSTNLFRNAIFGVYHDINPSSGGKIGWELIELNSGCRALVASWSDVPMFSCTTSNYSGMIVLYENTNIIEVYVKEKNVCSSWNNGNAIIGIQNGAGTQAVVPPNRNGLSPDWTTSNEAWRFTPSGTSVTAVKWYQGSTATGTVIGTGNTISVCPNTTTQYTAKVDYTLCSGGILTTSGTTTVTVDGKAKTWTGTNSNDWNNAANWNPTGVPTSINCVSIPTSAPSPTVITSAASAKSVSIVNNGSLTIGSNHSLELQNAISVGLLSSFNVNDKGSLVQVNNVVNTGIMKMKRDTKPMYRFDYSYWNSPVTTDSNFTLAALSPNTLADKYYKWQPFYGASHGNWVQTAPSANMVHTNGFIIRAPQSFSTSPEQATKQVFTATFVGVPNNGDISIPVSRGTMSGSDDDWNLIGNPYPSAVSALDFVNANAAFVDGTIYFWTHNSALSALNPNPFYGTFATNYSGADYATWNSLAATAATTGGPVPNGYLAAGASFFIKSKVASGNVTFKNSMRVRGFNDQFLKSSTDFGNSNETDFEKHRIWLNMMNSTNVFSQIVVGYAAGATLGYDSGLDAERLASATTAFYSIIEDYNLAIQGRPLPFDPVDVVPLGYVTDTSGEFSIGLHETDPLFSEYDILLEDKTLEVVHNLKLAPYYFTTVVGRFDTRFNLKYIDNLLSVNDHAVNTMLSTYIKDQYLNVKSSESIETVTIYDVTGKQVVVFKPESVNVENKWRFPYAQGAYFAKFKLANGKEVNRKLLH